MSYETLRVLNTSGSAADRNLYASIRVSELRRMMGGQCTHCGYNLHEAALVFHHVHERDKRLRWGYVSRERAAAEAKKCILLCANDHIALHSGQITLDPVRVQEQMAKNEVSLDAWLSS